jgi:hypothetical protein
MLRAEWSRFRQRWFKLPDLKLRANCATQYKRMSKALGNRFLEAFLGDILSTAEAHKKKGVRLGDQRYKILWSKVDARLNTFCSDHDVQRIDIEAQVPALLDLERYAKEPEPSHAYFNRIGIAVAIPVSVFLLGLTSGTAQWLFHLGHHLVLR